MSAESLAKFLEDVRAIVTDEDEWAGEDRFPPLQVVPPRRGPSTQVLVSTKLNMIVHALGEDVFADRTMVLGHYGIWSANASEILRALCGDRPISFVGDLDPLDLTAWWTLQEAHRRDVALLGITSEWIDLVEPGASIRNVCIPMTAFEREHWSLLKLHNPTVPSVIGASASKMLDDGHKLELEAFVIALELGTFVSTKLRGNEGVSASGSITC